MIGPRGSPCYIIDRFRKGTKRAGGMFSGNTGKILRSRYGMPWLVVVSLENVECGGRNPKKRNHNGMNNEIMK